MLKVKDLSVKAQDKKIVNNISFEIKEGDIVHLIGSNGAGKSTLLSAIMGLSQYTASGKIIFDGKDITNLPIEQRANMGLYLSYQNPVEIEGLSVSTFLKYAINNLKRNRGQKELTAPEYFAKVYPILEYVGLDKSFLSRNLNHNFSGGEKKKFELLQILLFEPTFVMLDEIDSGADTKTKEIILETIKDLNKKGVTFLIVTHNPSWVSDLKLTKEISLI